MRHPLRPFCPTPRGPLAGRRRGRGHLITVYSIGARATPCASAHGSTRKLSRCLALSRNPPREVDYPGSPAISGLRGMSGRNEWLRGPSPCVRASPLTQIRCGGQPPSACTVQLVAAASRQVDPPRFGKKRRSEHLPQRSRSERRLHYESPMGAPQSMSSSIGTSPSFSSSSSENIKSFW